MLKERKSRMKRAYPMQEEAEEREGKGRYFRQKLAGMEAGMTACSLAAFEEVNKMSKVCGVDARNVCKPVQ